jgi:hypothetical protein
LVVSIAARLRCAPVRQPPSTRGPAQQLDLAIRRAFRNAVGFVARELRIRLIQERLIPDQIRLPAAAGLERARVDGEELLAF